MDRGKARVVGPDRSQLRWDLIDIEGLLAGDHRARMVWAFVEGLNLEPLYELIESREGEAGRPPADPAVVLALWLYASLEGLARRVSWPGCASATRPIAGFAAG